MRLKKKIRSIACAGFMALAALCSGGCEGGGGTVLAVLEFESLTSNAPENVGTHNVVVKIWLRGFMGGPTTIDFSVQLDDDGTGTATSGSDYTTIATQTVTFPVGTYTQYIINIPITISDDAFVENPETINLIITQPSPANGLAQIGANNTHTITIVDND